MTPPGTLELLHLASEYNGKVYGLGRFVHGLARAQAARGHRVQVVTNSAGGDEDDVLLDGVQVHRIAAPNPPQPADGHGEVLQWNHGVVSRVLDRLERFRAVDLILAHDWLTAIAAREVADLLGKPLVVTVHDEVVGKHQGVLGPEAAFVRALEALTAHDATHLIANSRYIARQLERHYGVASERITAIPGGIDPALLDVAAPDEVPPFRRSLAEADEVLVLYAGRLDPEKGLGTLARAWPRVQARCPKARLLVAGSGRLEPLLREQLAHGVRFLGYVERETLGYLYRAADVVVIPSIYEPFGLVALEAMTAGRAAVTSTAGGLAEIVRDQEDGLTVPPAMPEALADALLRLLQAPDLRRRLGEAARQRALRDFTWNEIARRTHEAYVRALSAAPHPLKEAPPTLPPTPLVSILLVTHDAPVYLRAALRSLVQRTHYRPLEVLIADEGHDPATRPALLREVEWGRAQGLQIRVHASEGDAAQAARGELLLRLVPEVEVPTGSEEWLSGLVWLLEETGAASVSPTLLRRAELVTSGARIPEPRREDEADSSCALRRRHEGAAVPDTSRPGQHWRHSVPLVLARDEAGLSASIVIVAYKHRELTRAAIEAVLQNTAPPFELVLVDNGSGDGTRELFLGYEGALGGAIPVQVLENEENLGYPVGANQGVRAARGKHVVLLNNDTRVRASWLQALLVAAESGPRVGVVTAKVLNLDGSVQSAGGVLHAPEGSAFEIPFQGEDRLAPPVSVRRELDNAGGPCMLLTRGLLDAFPEPFDAAYSPGYFEDSDLCLRARSQGWTLLYEPAAEVLHHGKATADLVAREGKTDVWAQFERNRQRFLSAWSPSLAADHARRQRADAAPRRARILLCYGRSQTTTAAYLEQALRREHDVVTAGPGQELDLGQTSARALVEAAGGQVDLLLVVEGENYVPDALEDAPCTTAAWLIDTHLHARDPQGWHLAFAPRVDHVLLAQRDDLPRFHAAGLTGASWLPLACAPDVHVQPTPARGRDLDVVFVGHLLPIHARRRRLLELLRSRFRVHVAEGVFLADMAGLFARARIVWNCSLAGDLNMRVFEGLASGALVVTDRIEAGLSDLFAPGEHLLTYEDEQSLLDVVSRALADGTSRQEIARRGQRLALRHHTYAHRARTLLERTIDQPITPRLHAARGGAQHLRVLAGGRA